LSDNVGGARLAIDHLVALGHRRIGHIAGPAGNAAAPDRLAGARLALDAAGFGADHLAIAVGDGHVAGGARATADLLAADPGLTAVFAYNDLSAIGAIRALRAAGLRVPADVSVVGFDDVDLAAYADPPLTTVAQDIASLGRRAAERLLELVDGEARSAAAWGGPTILPVRLVVRGSTAAPPVA
jgi:DNA-binding LacI/PurR family transcriptional regulator